MRSIFEMPSDDMPPNEGETRASLSIINSKRRGEANA